jgi:hypothetical protein
MIVVVLHSEQVTRRKIKLKFTLEKATKAQRESGSVAVLFL